jgi:hypothetical protein
MAMLKVSLCGCIKQEFWNGPEDDIFFSLVKMHYEVTEACRLTALRDPIWLQRVPVRKPSNTSPKKV